MFGLKNTKEQSFTLIELLLVIAIIGILSGLVFVGMAAAADQARVAKAKAFAHSIEENLGTSNIGKYNNKVEKIYSDVFFRDESPSKKDGRLWNGTATSSDTPFGSSPEQISLSFDGIDDYLWIPDSSPSALKPTSQLTVSAFFKAAEFKKTGYWYSGIASNSCWVGGSTGYLLGVMESGGKGYLYGRVALKDYGDVQVYGTIPISKNKWYHAALTYSQGDKKVILYLDGKKDSEASPTSYAGDGSIFYDTYYGNQSELRVGSDPAVGDKEFNGLIDNVQVYSAKFESQ